MNRFKGLDLVDKSAWRTTDTGSWHYTGGSDQNHLKEKEMQEGKVVVWVGFAEKIEVKGKGERERYTQSNAEFQRIARRDKKAFLNEECKEMKTIEWEH